MWTAKLWNPLFIAALVGLLALPLASALCYDPDLVNFGTGETTLLTKQGSGGSFRVSSDNTFTLESVCTLTGSGANTRADRWRALLIYCGTDSSCKDANLVPLGTTRSTCDAGSAVGKSCNMKPTSPVSYQPSTRSTPSQYSVGFKTTISNAWRGATTYYYLKCFYLCGGSPENAQERAAASFTLEGDVSPPPPPSPAPSPSPPPPLVEPNFYGISTAIINSPLKQSSGIIYAPRNNTVPVEAVCKVSGEYALVSRDNWPAQVLVCGEPNGSGSCSDTSYDPSGTIIKPVRVDYDGTTYTAVYEFNVPNAVINARQMITYRFFSCLYVGATGRISRRAGASLDVVNKAALTPTVTRPPPPAPVQTAQGYGDPHFVGFDGVGFKYHGAPGSWYTLLYSKQQPLSLRTLFAAGRLRGTTVMRAFELRSGKDTIKVDLSLPPTPVARQLSVTANTRALAVGGTRLLSGTTIQLVPGGTGTHGRVVITTDSMRLVIIQKWRAQRNALATFLDFNLVVSKPLAGPVTGVLARSYTKATTAKAGVAAAAAVQTLSASSESLE